MAWMTSSEKVGVIHCLAPTGLMFTETLILNSSAAVWKLSMKPATRSSIGRSFHLLLPLIPG